jgi:hypothetical protein
LKKYTEGEDAGKMERLEQQWRNNIRRQKQQEARRAKIARKKELEKQMAEMKKLFADQPDMLNISSDKKTDNMLTPAELLAKAKKRRGEIERKDVQEAKDKEQAKRRAEGVKLLVEQEKKKRGQDLTR